MPLSVSADHSITFVPSFEVNKHFPMAAGKVSVPPLESLGATQALLQYNVSTEDIEEYEKAYRKQVAEGEVDIDTKFQYAWCLVHSKDLRNVKKALVLLEELFKAGNEQTKRDSLFYLAVAQTKLKDYVLAKKYIKAFLSVEPANVQAQHLDEYVEKNLKKDGIAGMAIFGGAAILGGAAAIAVGGLVLATGIGMAITRVKNWRSKK